MSFARVAAVVAALLLWPAPAPATVAARWIGTWEAAPAWANPAISFTNTTLREIVHVSIGGALVRVRFSNAFGTEPLTIGGASIAVRAGGSSVAAKPLALRFDRASSIVVSPGAEALSDPAALRVPSGGDLSISIYLPGRAGSLTVHPYALQTNYAAAGNHVADVRGTAYRQNYQAWYVLSGVDVSTANAAGAVVALGDSITDGGRSLPNQNGRWPDVLARRLLTPAPTHRLGVLNAGISGNRLLLDGGPFGINALARFDRDVLAQSGVRDVLILLGINDMQQKPQQVDPLRIEAGLAQLAARAHEHGLRVLACTILPSGGNPAASRRVQSAREAVNAFIRTSKAFDGVCDFDAALRDPADPDRLLPAYDSGDHLHPNTAGLKVMGSLIDLNAL